MTEIIDNPTIIGIDQMFFGLTEEQDVLNQETVVRHFLMNKPVPLTFFNPDAPKDQFIVNCKFDQESFKFIGEVQRGDIIIGFIELNAKNTGK